MDPLLIDVPDRLTTDRLVIRCPRPADAPALNAAVHESMAELRPFIPWATHLPTHEQSNADCRRMQARYLLREDLVMFLFERMADGGEGRFVGGTGLHRIDWPLRRFEIGYWCRTSMHGRGLVAEAVRALARLAFDTLEARRVEVRMDPLNLNSRRVAERTGFTFEGVLRQNSLNPQGEVRDTRVYARVRGIEEPAHASK